MNEKLIKIERDPYENVQTHIFTKYHDFFMSYHGLFPLKQYLCFMSSDNFGTSYKEMIFLTPWDLETLRKIWHVWAS